MTREAPASPTRSIPSASPALVAMLFLAAAFPAAAEPPPDPFDAATVNVRSYYDVDGLPQNSVESMSLDHDGRLWVTTRDGGAVFDGTNWVTIPMPDHQGSNWPREVASASDGTVWFSVDPGGLYRKSGSEWSFWDVEDGLPGRVNAMLELDGAMIVATTGGICAFPLSSPSPTKEHVGVNVVALARGSKGVFALTAEGQVLRRARQSWVPTALPSVSSGNPRSLLVTKDEVLVGTASGVVGLTESAEPIAWEIGAPVTSLAETRLRDGVVELWAGTEGKGLWRLEDGTWSPVSPRITVPNRYIYDLVATPGDESAAHLLVGTLSGIARIDLGAWHHVGTPEGLPEASVVSILESRTVFPGTYFLGTTGGLAVFGASGRWEPSTCELLRAGGVFAMSEIAERNAIYAGTDSGVVVLDAAGCRRMTGLDGVAVVAFEQTGGTASRLWAGTYGDGLWFLDDSGVWRPSGVELPDQHVEALAASGSDSDTLWIATNDGLVRLREGTPRVFDETSGLPHGLVRSVLVHDHELWVGTSRGLAHARVGEESPVWKPFDLLEDGRMANATVYRIEAGDGGRIYAFTGRGIARLDPDDAPGNYRLGRVFLSDDGLPSSETNFGASLVDSEGRIWAGTPLGAGIFDPRLESEPGSTSHRLVVTLATEPEGEAVRNGAILSSNADRIVASFRLIDLVHGHRAVYRTQLVGLDSGPGDWSATSQRVFSQLPGGRFELNVWARDPHGHEAGPAVITFSVQQPAWLSWWAVLVYVAGSVILLYTFVGLRIRSLRQRNQELELIVRSRTRDLEVANRQLESANVTLTDMSVTDPLTGSKNRRYLLQRMEQEAVRVRRSTREADDIVFILVDIDRFKYVNDRFGHATGDRVLKEFHGVLANAVRDTDTIVRWGGEEFLIVARHISRDEAVILAQRILEMVRDARFQSSDASRHLRLTCSIGLATFPFVTWDRSLFTWEQVVDIADHCLYAVKRSGRDGWVSLAAGSQLRADSFLSRMRDDVDALTAGNEVTVLTSFADPTKLRWR